ncbi:MAG: hypothetical protein AAB668_00485 [Patescibacteria group bacterium]
MNWILPLFKPSFWFNLQTVPFMPWLERFLPFFLVVLFLVASAVFVYIRRGKWPKETRRFIRRVGTCIGWAGASGLVLYFFHWQAVPYLSMRILWLFWIGGFGYWGYDIWHDHFRVTPAQKAKEQERAAYEKWLPKPGGR